MRDKLLLLLYLFCLLYLSFSSHIYTLLIALVLLLMFLILSPIERKLKLLKHAFLSFFLFSFFISFSYLLFNQKALDYFLMINLRSFDLSLLTFIFLRMVNLYKAFDFSKTLSFLLVMAVSNAITYNRLLKDFKDAIRSRTLQKPKRKTLVAFTKRLSLFFFEKSINTSREVQEAMRSRGFYND
ncbi:MAG TPA: ABC transporter permease [Aquificaceae bacterium]|nr:ABC transporter permease [Aquificaceae bacterium]